MRNPRVASLQNGLALDSLVFVLHAPAHANENGRSCFETNTRRSVAALLVEAEEYEEDRFAMTGETEVVCGSVGAEEGRRRKTHSLTNAILVGTVF
jgi:hypothetical protein